MVLPKLTVLLLLAAGACGGSHPARPAPPPAAPPAPPAPLTTKEMQEVVDGASRLNAGCRRLESPTGLYLLRLTIEPEGAVSNVEPMRAPPRGADPATFAGVPRYIDGDHDPDTPVVRCFVAAFRKLRFRRFGGPTVAFDYPIMVENLPPSEATGEDRACEQDEDCVFRPPVPCACNPCGHTWRRAVSRRTLAKWQRSWRRRRRRRCRRRCQPCTEPLVTLGSRALCIDRQCSVR